MSKKRKVEKELNKIKELGFKNDVYQTIHIVSVKCGFVEGIEEEWDICSYENEDEELAKEHVKNANEFAEQVRSKQRFPKIIYNRYENPYDINLVIDDVNYYTRETKLIKPSYVRTNFIASSHKKVSKTRKIEKGINKVKSIGFENEIFETIYTVFGECGFYPIIEKWDICSYENEELAGEHVKKSIEYAKQFRIKQKEAGKILYRCESPYDIRVFSSDVRYDIKEIKLIKVIKWPFLRTIFIAYYREVDSPFYKEKLPIDIFKLICKYVVKEYRF